MEESLYLCKWSDRTNERHDIPIRAPNTVNVRVYVFGFCGHDAGIYRTIDLNYEMWSINMEKRGKTIFVVKGGTHICDARYLIARNEFVML